MSTVIDFLHVCSQASALLQAAEAKKLAKLEEDKRLKKEQAEADEKEKEKLEVKAKELKKRGFASL